MADSDVMSNLPDKILIHILSFLPTTKARIQTSILSKRWRHLWPSTPSLDFPLQSLCESASASDIKSYRRIVDRCLDLYPNRTLQRLRVDDTSTPSNCEILRNSSDIFHRWISFASSRSVRDLHLCFHHPFLDSINNNPRLSPSLFLCYQTLTSLNLDSCRFPSLPAVDFKGFPSLKTLHLRCVLFSRCHEFHLLLSSSPLLETLTIDACRWVPNIVLRIVGVGFQNLKRFKFQNHDADSLAIEAPNLRFLDYGGRFDRLYLRSCPRLIGASFRSSGEELKSCEKLISLMQVIDTVEILVASYWFFPQCSQFERIRICKNDWCNHPEPKFKNLREFHCHGIVLTGEILRALIFYLCKCSSLEKLCINLEFDWCELPELHEREVSDGATNLVERQRVNYQENYLYYKDDDYYELFRMPSRLPKYQDLLPRLKIVILTQFSDDSMELIEFLLCKAAALELLRINFVQQQHVEMDQLQRQILSFTRASTIVQIELSEVGEEEYDSCVDKCSPSEHLWSF